MGTTGRHERPAPWPAHATGSSRGAGGVALLEMTGQVKHFRRGDEDVVALAGVDLAVDAGELVALVGRSGSGKSTLLHLAGGLDVPDAGTVSVAGRDLAQLPVAERATVRRRDVGLVFQ